MPLQPVQVHGSAASEGREWYAIPALGDTAARGPCVTFIPVEPIMSRSCSVTRAFETHQGRGDGISHRVTRYSMTQQKSTSL